MCKSISTWAIKRKQFSIFITFSKIRLAIILLDVNMYFEKYVFVKSTIKTKASIFGIPFDRWKFEVYIWTSYVHKIIQKKKKCFCVEICLGIYTKCSTATIMVHNSDDVNVLKRISYKSLCTLWGMASKMGNYNHMVSGTLF